MERVIFEESGGGLARITLNWGEKRDASTLAMLARLTKIFSGISERNDLRAVVLCAEGDTFSIGADIDELALLDHEGLHAVANHARSVCESIESSRVPVIAAVKGLAAGVGCELVLACHIRIASEDARFSLPEAKKGVTPPFKGIQRLVRLKDRGRAVEMMLSGDEVSADEALRSGLINRVVARDQVLSEAETLAREIASLAPLAIRACLEAVTRGLDMPLEEGLKLETELFSSLFATEDVREGTSAFFEKRRPVFKGR